MADEEATKLAEEAAPESGGKKGSSFITYIIIAVVMVAAGYFVGTTMSGGKSADGETQQATTDEASNGGGHGESSEEADHAAGSADIFMLNDVIVNPSGTGGTRFLSVSIGFEVGSEPTLTLLEEREPIIKDALITILGAKTIEQLTDAKEKEITRFQIRKRIEHLLHVEDISAVYYTDYILQ